MPIEWKDVQKWISDTTNVAVRESKELARKGRVQYDIIGLKHTLTEAVTELGGLVYQLIEHEPSPAIHENERVKALVARIHELELELKKKEQERDKGKHE